MFYTSVQLKLKCVTLFGVNLFFSVSANHYVFNSIFASGAEIVVQTEIKKKKTGFQIFVLTTDKLIVPLQTHITGCANVPLKNSRLQFHFGATSGALHT